MKYMIWSCKDQDVVKSIAFKSQAPAQRVCDAMNAQMSKPLYVVVVRIEEVICF